MPESVCPGLLGGASKAQEYRIAALRPLLSISPCCDCDDGFDDATSVVKSESLPKIIHSLNSTLVNNGSHLPVTVLLSGKDMKDNRLLIKSNNHNLRVSFGQLDFKKS